MTVQIFNYSFKGKEQKMTILNTAMFAEQYLEVIKEAVDCEVKKIRLNLQIG